MKFRVFSLAVFSIFSSSLMSERVIDLVDEKIVNDLLLNKTWTCYSKSDNQTSTMRLKINVIEGSRVQGRLDIPQYEICNSEDLKGILIGNSLTYYAPASIESCNIMNGVMVFHQNENGEIEASGHYTFGELAEPDEYTCELNNS
ncbi:MAG: hypothetical protein AAGB35_06195 [Pseudomonadota bacterium]